MLVGFADSDTVGPVVEVTVTVTVAVDCPPAPVAVSVYVVVAAGLTFTVPFGGKVPATPLMVTWVAFVVVQLRMADDPNPIVAGVAVKEVTALVPVLSDEFLTEAPIPWQPLIAKRKTRIAPESKNLKAHFTAMVHNSRGPFHPTTRQFRKDLACS
jgi:hypothetical protein